ncbi:MAG: GAF domain-containing sensor histidine kinase [Candidatus Omnitrophica bacterium]|nr:GAF domain-containing sensor histidine kinase [Candidatus Omnitrophota bacterium]
MKEANVLLRDFLNDTLKEIMSAVSADCGSLFLFDESKNELVLDSFYNSQKLELGGLRKKVGDGISGKIAQQKTPVLVDNIDKDERFKRNGFNHYYTKSFISIPLINHKGIIGLINITDKKTREPFDHRDLEFASILARYASTIVEHLLRSSELNHEREKLNKKNSSLEKYASVGKLAAGVVHEINSPLDGIIRYTNILLEHIDNNSIAREYLVEVKKGLNRIANITRSLLEFSHQVNSNSFNFKRYVDVERLVEDSLDILNGKLKENIKIIKKYKEKMPRILDLGFQHVVLNIIKNALDAMPGAGELEITADIDDLNMRVDFKDSGSGIPNDIMNHIFEPFFTTKDVNEGTGLGLSMCREIINKYEGRIEVKSSPGEGSKFSILIPVKHLENG